MSGRGKGPGAIGMGFASILDGTVLAWKRPGDLTFAGVAMPEPAVVWLPSVGIALDSEHRAGPTFGVRGAF